MPQNWRLYLMVASLVLSGIALILRIIEVWPILSSQLSALFPAALVHLGALICATRVSMKSWRKQALLPTEAFLLSALILATWLSDLRLISKFAGH